MAQAITNILVAIIDFFTAGVEETTDAIQNIKNGEGQFDDYMMIGCIAFVGLVIMTIVIGLAIVL